MHFKYLSFTAGVVMTLWFALWFGFHFVSAGANERPEKTNSNMQIAFDEAKLKDRKLRAVIALKDAISARLSGTPT